MELNVIDFLNALNIKLHSITLYILKNHSITAKSGNHCTMKLGMVSAKSHLPAMTLCSAIDIPNSINALKI